MQNKKKILKNIKKLLMRHLFYLIKRVKIKEKKTFQFLGNILNKKKFLSVSKNIQSRLHSIARSWEEN